MSLISKFLERRKRRKELKVMKEELNNQMKVIRTEMRSILHDPTQDKRGEELSDLLKQKMLESREIDRALGKRHLPDYEKYVKDW